MRTVALYGTLVVLLAGILILFSTHPGRTLGDFNPLGDANHPLKEPHSVPLESTDSSWTFDYRKDGRNYGLSDEQCSAAFPELTYEIDRAVEYRKDKLGGRITEDEVDVSWAPDSMIRAMIHDNQLYIIDANHVEDVRERPRTLATLSAIHRAITAYPGKLPNIEFSFSVHDWALHPTGASNRTTWSYTRSGDQEKLWLMPDFNLWGWPDVGIRSYAELQQILFETEDKFLEKIPKLVWRGSLGVGSKDVRQGLLDNSKNKPWSDVLELKWDDAELMAERLLTMQDHCAYMFVAQTEGNSYSGRLKFLLNCHSVVFSHRLKWIEPYHHLMRHSGPEQNYVQVQRDYADLDSAMARFVAPHQWDHARQIADNSRRMFRERYLTPAAEACYWRSLIRAWSGLMTWTPEFWIEKLEYDKVSKKEKMKKKPRGVPFEAFVIMEEVEWPIPAKTRKLCIQE